MKMSYGFEIIAEAYKGIEFGHVPGHRYRDVEVAVGKRGSQYRAVVLETWGSAHGFDEEDARKKVVARSNDPRKALREVLIRARDSGLKPDYLAAAASECEDELEAHLSTIKEAPPRHES